MITSLWEVKEEMNNENEKNIARCKVARNVKIDGKRFKVVDPKDPCSSVNRVLARHEGAEVITPQEYEKLRGSK